jgi:hypothetical protein
MMNPRQTRLPDEMHAAIEREALNEDRAVSSMMRQLLREALERRGAWPMPMRARGTSIAAGGI